MRLIFVPVMALLLAVNAHAADEVNLYTNSYKSRGLPTIALEPDNTGAKIYRGEDKEADYRRMLENGFDIIGESSFEAGNVPPELASEQAAKVNADLVLVYTSLKGKTPASVQVQQMRERARKAKAESAGEAMPEPEEQEVYAYYAAYWVKLAPPLIGVHVKQSKDAPEGLTVVAVVKQSPAFNADIQANDVLTRIGEVELTKPEALSQAAKRYAGQTVEIRLVRNDQPILTSMTLNKRK